MLRWTSYENRVNMTGENPKSTYLRQTHASALLPIYGNIDEEMRSIESIGRQDKQSDISLNVNYFGPCHKSKCNIEDITLRDGRKAYDLPLIQLPSQVSPLKIADPLREGVLTGATNGASMSLLGAIIGVLFCPVSVLQYALGFGTAGVASGAVQAHTTAKNNNFLTYCSAANDFLLEARAHGISDEAKVLFRQMEITADTPEKHQVLLQLSELCEQAFGPHATAVLR